MVYGAIGETIDDTAISLAREFADRPQPVSVVINGFDYPGEVIFADQWQSWFGFGLPERVMFRLVLLSEGQRVTGRDVKERRIAVAVPPALESTYEASDFVQLNREISRLNEIRERYMTSSDTELQSLASSLTGRTSEAQRSIASSLAERWRRGRLITVTDDGSAALSGDSIFIGDDPGTWVEAIAAAMFTRPDGVRFTTDRLTAEALFMRIVATDESGWRGPLDDRLRVASGSGLDSIDEELKAIASGAEHRIPGEKLRGLLLRHPGLPPTLASLLLITHVKMYGGQAESVPSEPSGNPRLDAHTLSTEVFRPDLIYSIQWLSGHHTADWNSALSYVRAFVPNAEPSRGGEPAARFERRLIEVLQVTESRTALTLRTLESVSGPLLDTLPNVALVRRLIPVLDSDNWVSFYASATLSFPEVAEFAEAVAESFRLRALSEDVVDVQAAYDYVSGADFGRQDQAIASDAELLLARLDVSELLLNNTSAAPVLHDFQQWRLRFSRSYLAHHAERRSADLELARRVKRADLQHTAVRKLVSIQELDGIYDPQFETLWRELRDRVQPCLNREPEVGLKSHPYCSECGVRLGSPGHEDEVEERIAEIEHMLRQCSVRLSEIAVSRVLSGEREGELRDLIRINSIADLTAISDLLDDGVMSFLKRFARDSTDVSPGSSGKPGRSD